MRFSIISTIILAPLALAAATPKAEPAPEITSRKLALGSILSLLPVGSLDPDCVAGCVGNITTCVKPTADLTSLLSVLKCPTTVITCAVDCVLGDLSPTLPVV